jgi:hypothetical protein
MAMVVAPPTHDAQIDHVGMALRKGFKARLDRTALAC